LTPDNDDGHKVITISRMTLCVSGANKTGFGCYLLYDRINI